MTRTLISLAVQTAFQQMEAAAQYARRRHLERVATQHLRELGA